MQDVRAAAKGAVAVARIASVGAGFGTDIAAAFDDDVPVVIGSVVHAAAAAAAAVDRTKRTPPQGATAQPPLSRRRPPMLSLPLTLPVDAARPLDCFQRELAL